MLEAKKDFNLISYIGDSLSQDNHISDPAFVSALSLTAQANSDVHLVLLACRHHRYFRWVVKDLILFHHENSDLCYREMKNGHVEALRLYSKSPTEPTSSRLPWNHTGLSIP